MKLAYADRSEYLGDPDRTAIPVEQLTSEDYLDQRRTIIRDEVAIPQLKSDRVALKIWRALKRRTTPSSISSETWSQTPTD